MNDKAQELIDRITAYLWSGGLFNPELANEETSLPYDSYSEKIKKHFGVE